MMRLALVAAAACAALLAGCATEGAYYGSSYPYYGYGYGYDYYDYGPAYYSAPGYFSFSYGDGGGHRWNGDHDWNHWRGTSRSYHGTSAHTPRSYGVRTAHPRASSRTHVAHGDHVARQPSHLASRTRTGPDREHGG
ncbi:MAG TPA: hypothetical protein VL742_20090 [Casimicrobiaceae bacterium]|nr:hypothetical protein [Casimicrobiaceae bacterium]